MIASAVKMPAGVESEPPPILTGRVSSMKTVDFRAGAALLRAGDGLVNVRVTIQFDLVTNFRHQRFDSPVDILT